MLGMIANPHSNKVMCQENRNSPDSPICFPEHMIPDDQGYNNIDFRALLNRPNLDGQGNSNIADHLKSSVQMEMVRFIPFGKASENMGCVLM